jgi:hypothetical protein
MELSNALHSGKTSAFLRQGLAGRVRTSPAMQVPSALMRAKTRRKRRKRGLFFDPDQVRRGGDRNSLRMGWSIGRFVFVCQCTIRLGE